MKMMKYIAIIVVSISVFAACNNKEKQMQNISDMQMEVDSILSEAGVLTPEQRAEVNTLVDAYVAFAEKYPEDSLGAAYLFEAARLKTRMPDFEGAISLFRKVADTYPKNDLAPKSLLSIGGIYDVTLNDYQKAEAAYLELKTKYPTQATEYGIDMVLKTLGKSPDEILRELQANNMDTLSMSEGVLEEETDRQ